MPTIILEKSWTMTHTGVVKNPGTELTFAKGEPEAAAILESGCGFLKAALPVDLPGRNEFIRAGFDSLQSIREVSGDWTAVKGIGPKTAEEIDAYFNNEPNEE